MSLNAGNVSGQRRREVMLAMTKKAVASPEAAGGAGTLFEYRVGAIVLTHLLAQSIPPGLVVPVVSVGLQQRVRWHLLDDIVVYG